MAKNKNQNRHQRAQQDERSGNPPMEPQEQAPRAVPAEDHGMPATGRVARRQQKKFGHN